MTAAILGIGGDVALTVFGAVVIAYITAVTTNRRQDRQLSNDRVEADRAELRAALDGAAAAAIDAMHGLVSASGHVRPESYDADAPVEVLDTMHSYMRDHVRDGLETITALTPYLGRLQLRLGGTHPVVVAYRELTECANEVSDAIPRRLPGTRQEAEEAEVAAQVYTNRMGEFIESAHALVGTSAPALAAPSDESR